MTIAAQSAKADYLVAQIKTAVLVTAVDNAKEIVLVQTKIALDCKLINAIKRQGTQKAHILVSNTNRIPELVQADFNINVPDDDIKNNFIIIDNKLLILFNEHSCKWTKDSETVAEYLYGWHYDWEHPKGSGRPQISRPLTSREHISRASRSVYVRTDRALPWTIVSDLKTAGPRKVIVIANRREDVKELIAAGIPVWIHKKGVRSVNGLSIAVDERYLIDIWGKVDDDPSQARRIASDCESLKAHYVKASK